VESRIQQKQEAQGGKIRLGFKNAVRRANLTQNAPPHTLRHTGATWHYVTHKDLMLLKREGGWESIEMVERYMHLMRSDMVSEVARFWGTVPNSPQPKLETVLEPTATATSATDNPSSLNRTRGRGLPGPTFLTS